MAELVPLKAVYDGSSICGLSELRDGDVVGIEHGGLGVCTLASNTLLIGNGQGAISTTSAMTTNGQIIIAGSSGPQLANLTGTSNEIEITDGDAAITIGLPSTVQISTNLKTPAFSITNEYCLPTADGSAGQIMCTDGSGALSFIDFDGSGHCIAFSGTTVADRTCLNFLGGGVTVSDNSGTNATDITIPVTTPELKVRNTAGCELSIELENTAIGGELVCDTTPQLGGTLDVNGYGITSISNGNISITPNGSGSLVLDGLSWPQADGTAGYILCTDGSGSLSWATDASGQSVAGSNTQLQFNNSGNFGASSNLTFDGSTLAVTGGMTLSSTSTISGDMTFVDNAKVTLGTGGDADLYYDGTDVVLDPSVVGTGNFVVQVASSGADPNVKGLMVENSSSAAMTIGSGSTSEGMLHFADSEAANSGRIVYDHNANDMYFATAATERMRIDSAGDVHIASLFKVNVSNTGVAIGTSSTPDSTWTKIGANGGDVININGTTAEVGIGTSTMTGILNTNYTGTNHAHKFEASHASFGAQVLLLNAHRAATSAYTFLGAFSGNTGDLEFNLRGDGNAYADGSWSGSGADYQEFFESLDGTELEVGKAVVLDGDKVRVYDADTDSADNIMGITRPQADNKNSAVIGNTAWNHWTDKYLTDDWGVYLREDVTVWEWDKIEAVEASEGIDAVEGREKGSCYERDEAADWTPPEGATSSVQSVRKLNPEYSVEVDDATNYSPRADRVEWNLIGMLGQVQIKANEPTNPRWIKMKDISDAVELWMIR